MRISDFVKTFGWSRATIDSIIENNYVNYNENAVTLGTDCDSNNS